ncbi:MAG: carboxypeptidase-like regulatory domain-containing protein [Acidobacteriia bacterium]|nr:carboxypeptidase-like regulatory domain-containing protein [Terriglobia bacterium]
MLFGWMAVFGGTVAAQDNAAPDAAAATLQITGFVRTAGSTTVPGATLRVIQTSTGKAWVSWTDESGKFSFPDLPAGHYRVEISQLGFAAANREIDLASGNQAPLKLKLDVGTLAAITAPAPSENFSAAKERVQSAAPLTAAANSGAAAPGNQNALASGASREDPGGAPDANSGTPGRRFGGAGGAQGGGPGSGRNGPGGGTGRQGQGGGRRTFQQVGLNTQNQNNADTAGDDIGAADTGSQLGQAASADAVQMIGTVAMGQTQNQAGGFPQAGDGGPGGPDTQGAFGNGGNAIPGQAAPGAGPMGGPGGFGGGPGGGPVFAQRGGGGGGRGPRGPRGGPQGVDALWGAQRVIRQRINRVHYSFYDNFGDSALNARPYSLYQANPPKISSWTESAGINIGGPLKIPHVYDGTDKTFFYVNLEGNWARNPVDSFATVPTAAERSGDFSAANAQIYDPLSNLTGPRTLMPNAGCAQDAANAPGTCIPQNRISQQAISLLSYIPAPNIPVTSIRGQNFNYHLQTNLPGLGNWLKVNVTHQISSKLSLQVNYNLSNGTSHSLSSFPGIEGNTFTRGQSAMVGLTQNWTKTFLHTSQLYFSRNRSLGLNEFSNLTDVGAQLGLTGISTNPFDFGLPQIGFTNFTGLNDPNPSLNRSQTWRYVDSVRWMKDKHTVSAGGEIRKLDINRNTDPAANGQFAFTGLLTSQLTTAGTPVASPADCLSAAPSGPCIGSDFADFLLGLPANTKVQFGDTATYFRNWGFIGYASDDWHMFPKFTLTYGARYEAFTPPTELNGHIANLAVSPDFTTVHCVTPVATGNCVQGGSASLFNGHYNNWAPRVGLAWQPPGKWFSGSHQMTIRAGYSMFYVESYLNTLSSDMANQPPFATANTLTTQTVATPPLSFGTNLATALPATLTNTVAVNPNYQVPYAMIWSASIQYNLARGTFVEAMYTGTRGVHLDELLGFGPTNLTANAAGFTYDTTGAFSNFHALQLRVQKRMSHGVMFMARYTYSKSLDDASTIGGGVQTVIQNNADPRADYGLSSFNMTHQFLGNFVYQLPFGERERFARKGWTKQVFGAWRLNGSFTAHSGAPFTVRVFSKDPACQNVPGVNSERADQLGSAALVNPTIQEWFNTAAFSAPVACFGDAARNSVIGPGAFTVNSGLSKTFQFGRDGLRRLDFSWNANNLFNRVNYSGLSTVLGSSTFGQITGAAGMRTMQFRMRVNF